MDMNYSIFTRSGTVSIWLALKALDVTDKKIIIPANICYLVVFAIVLSGNRPVVVDASENGGIDLHQIRNLQDSTIAGVIYPYMYGNTGNILDVKNIATKNNWFLIEDVAQAFGAKINNVYAGSFGDVSVLSFGIGKPIDMKTGGAINFKSAILYKRIKELYEKLPYFSLKEDVNLSVLSNEYNKIIKNKDANRFSFNSINTYYQGLINKINVTDGYFKELDNKIKNIDLSVSIRKDYSDLFVTALKNNTHVNVVKHLHGSTYWRQNILVRENRDDLLSHLRSKKIKATAYFPSISRLDITIIKSILSRITY